MSKNMFFGREKEIAWLRGEFDACAVRNEKGEFSGPRMAFVIAETGVGKSRLVQELYHQLASERLGTSKTTGLILLGSTASR